jgi:hypothetical protein
LWSEWSQRSDEVNDLRKCDFRIGEFDAGGISLSIEWIEATGFQPVRFSERMRGLPYFEAARRVKLQNPGDPS